MQTQIPLTSSIQGHMATTRVVARPLRQRVEDMLRDGREVVLNFKGIQVTQSFVDELLGVLILKKGPGILQQLIFKDCSDDVEAIIRFVAADRSDQYIKAHSH